MLKAGFFLRVVEVYEQYCRPIVSNIDEITIRISGTGILFEGSVGPDRYIVILPYNKCHIQIRIFQKNCTPSFKNTIGFHRVHMQSICNQGSDHSERIKQTIRDRKNEDNHVGVLHHWCKLYGTCCCCASSRMHRLESVVWPLTHGRMRAFPLHALQVSDMTFAY